MASQTKDITKHCHHQGHLPLLRDGPAPHVWHCMSTKPNGSAEFAISSLDPYGNHHRSVSKKAGRAYHEAFPYLSNYNGNPAVWVVVEENNKLVFVMLDPAHPKSLTPSSLVPAWSWSVGLMKRIMVMLWQPWQRETKSCGSWSPVAGKETSVFFPLRLGWREEKVWVASLIFSGHHNLLAICCWCSACQVYSRSLEMYPGPFIVFKSKAMLKCNINLNLPSCRKLVDREPSKRCIFIISLFYLWPLINIYLGFNLPKALSTATFHFPPG